MPLMAVVPTAPITGAKPLQTITIQAQSHRIPPLLHLIAYGCGTQLLCRHKLEIKSDGTLRRPGRSISTRECFAAAVLAAPPARLNLAVPATSASIQNGSLSLNPAMASDSLHLFPSLQQSTPITLKPCWQYVVSCSSGNTQK